MPRPPLLTACRGVGTWLHVVTLCQGKWSCYLAPVSERGWEGLVAPKLASRVPE